MPEVAPLDVFRLANGCVSACPRKNIKDGTPDEGHTPALPWTVLLPASRGRRVHPRPFYTLRFHDESTRKNRSPRRAGHGIVLVRPPDTATPPRTMPMPGNPRGGPTRCICSNSEGGCRRTIGAVATLQSPRSRPRRWCDAGPPEADQKAGAPGSSWPPTHPIPRATKPNRRCNHYRRRDACAATLHGSFFVSAFSSEGGRRRPDWVGRPRPFGQRDQFRPTAQPPLGPSHPRGGGR